MAVGSGGAANGVSVLLNTHCQTRRLAFNPDVSRCNTTGAPFATQPALRFVDDGPNLLQCSTGNVTASIVPGTGTGGALLGGATAVPPVLGQSSYTNLSVNLPGRGYQLGFSHATAGIARSRTFSQGVVPLIIGPSSFCQGTPAVFDVGAGYDTYSWTLDGGPTFSTLPIATLPSVAPGSHTLQVSVTSDTCPASTSLPFTVHAPLSAVSIALVGPAGACTTCTGGTASASETGGGTLSRQWGFRTTSGGAITNIPGAPRERATWSRAPTSPRPATTISSSARPRRAARRSSRTRSR